VSNNFTGSEASGFIPIELVMSSSELANITIVIEVSLLEHSAMSGLAIGTYLLFVCMCLTNNFSY